ncbi:hypothetical protein GCM10027217_16550 [Pseudomaricurvus hydrocarbonicus]
MCRLSQLWDRLGQKRDIKSKRIILIDHPTKIAKSLYKRDALNKEWAEILWLRYNLDVLNTVREMI